MSKLKILPPVLAVLFFGAAFLLKSPPVPQTPDHIKTVEIAGRTLAVELALTPAEQEQGLSGRSSLKPESGMLFVFGSPGKYYFWMKDMKFDIDMIWLGEDEKVIYIAKDAKPVLPLKIFGPNQDAKYVLETAANFSDQNNLKIGDKVNFGY